MWVINELLTVVLAKFKRMEIEAVSGFQRNIKMERMAVLAITRGRGIPDKHVQVEWAGTRGCGPGGDSKVLHCLIKLGPPLSSLISPNTKALVPPHTHVCFQVTSSSPTSEVSAVVKSQSLPGVSYIVSDVLTPWATCNCPAGDQGELCKHRAKVLQVDFARITYFLGFACHALPLPVLCNSSTASEVVNDVPPLPCSCCRSATSPYARPSAPVWGAPMAQLSCPRPWPPRGPLQVPLGSRTLGYLRSAAPARPQSSQPRAGQRPRSQAPARCSFSTRRMWLAAWGARRPPPCCPLASSSGSASVSFSKPLLRTMWSRSMLPLWGSQRSRPSATTWASRH